jgi:hypothetical protein
MHVEGDIYMSGVLYAVNSPGFSAYHTGDTDYVLPTNTLFPPSGTNTNRSRCAMQFTVFI